MKPRAIIAGFAFTVSLFAAAAAADTGDPRRDILVTFHNDGARALGSGMSAPYRNRKRYAIGADARRNADAVVSEYGLEVVDHWPVRSLTVYCFVYRLPASADREAIMRRLAADSRVESVQPLQQFETGTSRAPHYNDTHVALQHSLATMGIPAAHAFTRGEGVRIAIVDSDAQRDHEDLRGRIRRVEDFTAGDAEPDAGHGTAVASVIGANANNGKGMVGIAPEAELELLVACWSDAARGKTICDSFTLAKSLDRLLEDPPDILNMSITGPDDPLLGRLLALLYRAGSVIVAAGETGSFPASDVSVVAAWPGDGLAPATDARLYAPARQIMVATPGDGYEFSSGSSLAAAHVSGIVALLLSASPGMSAERVTSLLLRSQDTEFVPVASINACIALQLANATDSCPASLLSSSEPGAEDDS